MSTTFIPAGRDPQRMAVLLLGTAEEYGFGVRSVRTVRNGFIVPEKVAELVYAALDKNRVKTVAETEEVEAPAPVEAPASDEVPAEAPKAEAPASDEVPAEAPKAPAKKKASGTRAAKTISTDKE